jgi:hypothetical protein
MTSLLSKLSRAEQRELLDDLNYLNMEEIKSYCRSHAIPFVILIEAEDGTRRRTPHEDRKGILLDRIRAYLRTGNVSGPTCFPASIVRLDRSDKPIAPDDRLFYGQYEKKNDRMRELLKRLTAGRFKDGAIARILAREFWSRGIAPTYSEFAAAWIEAVDAHNRPNSEWAYLADRADHKDTSDWKRLREAKAKKVLSILNSLQTSSDSKT